MSTSEQPTHAVVHGALMGALLRYLAMRPYQEVAPLYAALAACIPLPSQPLSAGSQTEPLGG
jgi:hypothetical protein